jgi:hypothetical protein
MIFGGKYYYFQIIKKMVVVFGSIFNDMSIERSDASGNETELIKVPIVYAPKEKMLARLQGDPALDRPYSALLPRMSFEWTDLSPDRGRHLPTMNKNVVKNSTNLNHLYYQYTPVPYNMKFNLYIYTKNAEDGTKILEQILPFFTPEWTASVELVPQMNETRDIPFVLDGYSIQDLYDGDFKTRRTLVHTLNFTCRTYLYGPVIDKPIIKFVTISEIVGDPVADGVTVNNAVEAITLQPGLLANGSPTSNIAQTIAYSLIAIDNDFGYVEQTLDLSTKD